MEPPQPNALDRSLPVPSGMMAAGGLLSFHWGMVLTKFITLQMVRSPPAISKKRLGTSANSFNSTYYMLYFLVLNRGWRWLGVDSISDRKPWWNCCPPVLPTFYWSAPPQYACSGLHWCWSYDPPLNHYPSCRRSYPSARSAASSRTERHW